MAAKSSQQHHSQTFSSATIRQGIGTSSTNAAACGPSSNTTSPPPKQQLPKTQASATTTTTTSSDPNDITDNSCLTSPNKLIMPAIQKSPSESLSSKTDTDKKCAGKARNKEGMINSQSIHTK